MSKTTFSEWSSNGKLFSVPYPMLVALEQARMAGEQGEVPVGCVITDSSGTIIARAHNETLTSLDPSAHAEILALRRAALHHASVRLMQCDLYVTLEPCAMCAAAMSHARIRRLYFGADDIKGGAVENGVRFFHAPSCFHRPDVYGGVGELKAASLLREFFSARR